MTTDAPEELKPKARPKRGTLVPELAPAGEAPLGTDEEEPEFKDDLTDEERALVSAKAREIFADVMAEPTATIKTSDGAVANANTGEVISPATDHRSLHERLLAVMNDIDAIEKRGENEAQHYNYVRAVDVTREVRKSFLRHGLILLTSITGLETKTFPSPKPTPVVLAEITCDFTVTDGVSSHTFGGAGTGIDVGDKGLYKAITGMIKYGLRALLLIPDERDDPEVPRSDEREVVIEGSDIEGVQPGGRQTSATEAQMNFLKARAQELDLNPAALSELIRATLGKAPELPEEGSLREQQQIVLDFVERLTFAELGEVLRVLAAASLS